MLSDTVLEILFRHIPECLLFIFSGYAFSKYKVQGKQYFISVVILAFIGYAIAALLPVEFGISQILIIIVCAALLISINHIPLQKAIGSVLGVMILGFITDIISVVIAVMIKGGDLKLILSDSTLFDSIYNSELERQLFGSISVVIMAIVLISIYYHAKKRDKLKDVPAGKSGE